MSHNAFHFFEAVGRSFSFGLGFVLEGHHCLPTVSGSNWKIVAAGFGRCNGGSAANAEILAFQCLVELIGSVLTPRTTFWKPFSPWSE